MDCIFCKLASGEIPTDVVYEDEKVFAFHDQNPQADTHVLLIPKKHVSGWMMTLLAEFAETRGVVASDPQGPEGFGCR